MNDLGNSLVLDRGDTISIAERMVASEGFKLLFREGMELVEATAAYLDGPGREDSRRLDRAAALAYASESMRLTTRLMQMTSWLLLQRAVNEGELTREEAEREHQRVKMAPQDGPRSEEQVGRLPEALQTLIARARRLHRRIEQLDSQLRSAPAVLPGHSPVASQLDALRSAFGR